MIDLTKKIWREKVTAEITLAHMEQFARELGSNMSVAEVSGVPQRKRPGSGYLDPHDAGRRGVR